MVSLTGYWLNGDTQSHQEHLGGSTVGDKSRQKHLGGSTVHVVDKGYGVVSLIRYWFNGDL